MPFTADGFPLRPTESAAPGLQPAASETGRRDPSAALWLAWLVLSALAVGALALVGVHLPASLKKLGLFAIAFGLLAGWLSNEIRLRLGRPLGRALLMSAAVFALIAAGQVGMAVESARLRRAEFDQTPEARTLRLLTAGARPVAPDDTQTGLQDQLADRIRERR